MWAIKSISIVDIEHSDSDEKGNKILWKKSGKWSELTAKPLANH